MSRHYDDPWAGALNGPWTSKMERGQAGCRYCGKPAAMNEPGKPWKAHKVCATGTASDGPLGDWDGEEHKATPDSPAGCGDDTAEMVRGRRCGANGGRPECQLCPRSPSYWRT